MPYPVEDPILEFTVNETKWDDVLPGAFQPITKGCKIDIWYKGSRTYVRISQGTAPNPPNNLDFWPSYDDQKDDKIWSREADYKDGEVDYAIHAAELTYDSNDGNGEQNFKVRIAALNTDYGAGVIVKVGPGQGGKTGQWY